MLTTIKKDVISEKVLECDKDTGKLYNLINNITGTTKENPLPDQTNKKALANEFAKFFLDKIQKIWRELDDKPKYQPLRTAPAKVRLMEFKVLSEDEVAKIIMNMKTKQCKLDTIPTQIIKEASPQIKLAMTKMVNTLLQSGTFAKKWNTALVKPLIKKLNLDRIKGSYRPVNNLKFLSKIVKCSMLNQFNDHCKQYNLIPNYQSAYRKNYSCKTTLAKQVNNILCRMERQEIMALMVIHLSAAFNMVHHQMLTEVLRNKFGIDGVALEWYKDYLYPKGYQVKVRDSILKVMDLPFSVPQGCCSGENLHSAYASTLQEVIPKEMELHGFAVINGIKTAFQQSPETRRQL